MAVLYNRNDEIERIRRLIRKYFAFPGHPLIQEAIDRSSLSKYEVARLYVEERQRLVVLSGVEAKRVADNERK